MTVAPYNHQSLQAEHSIKNFIPNFDKTFIRTRPDVAQIFVFGYFHS